MTALKLDHFTGLRPRFPESLLEANAATVAQNCDFAYGELRHTKDGFQLYAMSNAPKSLYTDDGASFFTWTTDVNAVRSPIAKDPHQRLLYTGDGGFKVANRSETRVNGGPPTTAHFVGVPKPTVAPKLTAALPSLNATEYNYAFKFHYELDRVKYQEQAINATKVGDLQWQFTPPDVISKIKTFSSIDKFPVQGSTTKIYKDSNTGTIYEWVRYEPVTPMTLETKDSFPSVGDADTYYLNREDGKIYRWEGDQYIVQTTKQFSSYTKLPDEPSKKYVYFTGDTSTYYVNYYRATEFVDKGTPEGAVGVLRVMITAKEDHAPICDVYSTNSAFSTTSGAYALQLSKDPDQNSEVYTATLSVGVSEENKETRAYIYTYVNTYDEEGPPSPAALVTTSPIVDVSLVVTLTRPTGYVPIKEIRVYRTPTGSTISDYFFVASIPVLGQSSTEFTFLDNVKGAELNEPISTMYDYPPEQDLVGLMALPNGILCAWRNNELHFSEAYKPWSWPPSYVQVLPHRIVGAIPVGSGAVVTTMAHPYLLSGVSPDSMTLTRLNIEQAGVSKWSMAIVNGTCVYASHDGIIALNGATASLALSSQFFTREVWRSRYGAGLSDMHFSVWDGRLIVFSPNNLFTPFMLRMDEAEGTMTDLPTFKPTCAFISLLSDQMYYAVGTMLYQFQSGDGLTATWQSKESILPRPLNFAFAQAVCTGSWTIEFYANGTLRHTKTVTDGVTNFRLPSGFMADRWKVKLTGKGRFRELRIAEGARELATV